MDHGREKPETPLGLLVTQERSGHWTDLILSAKVVKLPMRYKECERKFCFFHLGVLFSLLKDQLSLWLWDSSLVLASCRNSVSYNWTSWSYGCNAWSGISSLDVHNYKLAMLLLGRTLGTLHGGHCSVAQLVRNSFSSQGANVLNRDPDTTV